MATAAIPYLACMLATSHFYGLPPRVLPSIQQVEGGRPGLVHANANGTADLGLMQINTIWVRPIAEVTGQSPELTARRLIHDGCFSIAAAGAITRANLTAARGDLMLAVAWYHSRTPQLGAAYRGRVMQAALRLFESPARRQ